MSPRIFGNAGFDTRYGPAHVKRLINMPSKLAIVLVNLFEVADTPDYETIRAWAKFCSQAMAARDKAVQAGLIVQRLTAITQPTTL